ncbi:MAG TPA: aldo/keto reductase [Alphaproteobacteria bacterium]|nr:aldo/keto reductase [Alphaproteobacteria bacterium]
MRFQTFGQTGRSVPVIGQGTWNIERGDRKSAVAALRRGLDLGMTHIDTAEMYGSGRSEDIVGEAVRGRQREELFIVSKILPDNASRTGVKTACERSLKHLKTDYLDCYLLHWRGRHPLEETFAGFEELRRAGKIRSWGVSNFDTDDLDEARDLVGDGKIACNQVLYHLGERGIERGVIPWCEKHGVAVVAYTPFGRANLSDGRSAGGRVLEEIAKAQRATARQVALAFLARRPSVFTIPKHSSIPHAEENAGAGDLTLSEGEIAKIDQAFPLGRPRGLAML